MTRFRPIPSSELGVVDLRFLESTTSIQIEGGRDLRLNPIPLKDRGVDILRNGEISPLKYWEYRLALKLTALNFDIGKEIDPTTASRLGFTLIRIFVNPPNPLSLLINRGDRRPLYGIDLPGKSAGINFLSYPLLKVLPPTRKIPIPKVTLCIDALMKRPPERQDCVMVVSFDDLAQAGFKVYWIPRPTDPLHCRIVDAKHYETGRVTDADKFLALWRPLNNC